jgi:nitroreductase
MAPTGCEKVVLGLWSLGMKNILEALQWRYATKEFDLNQALAPELLETILESARLAPSSFGIEAWKFLVIENPALRQQLRAVAFDQAKVTDSPVLVVLARRTDIRQNIARELMERTAATQGLQVSDLAPFQAMVDGRIAGASDAELDAWARAQVYIPLGMMLETAALLGVDAGPMEGFMPTEVDKILGLTEQNLAATAMVAFGYRSATDAYATRPKVRRPASEVIEYRR